MGARSKIEVSGPVLRWAREQRGLTEDVAAKRLGISTERLLNIEAGNDSPSMAQLRTMSEKYKRPLIVLLLDEPPTTFTPLRDYRRLPDTKRGDFSPELHDEMKRASQQQEIYNELRVQLREAVVAPALPRNTDVRGLASDIRRVLDISILEQQTWRDSRTAYVNWRTKIEQLGILVLETSRVSMHEVRGFSLSENLPLVIVVNGEDSMRGKVFTMLHELAHLCQRQGSGVCDLHVRSTGSSDIEIFCNAVAGEALLPRAYLVGLPVVAQHLQGAVWTDAELEAIMAVAGGASKEVVLRRLLDAHRLSLAQYESARDVLQQEYEVWRKARSRKSTGGPPPYRMQLRDRGRPFIRSVFDAYAEGFVNLSEVVDLVGVRTKHLGNLEREAFS